MSVAALWLRTYRTSCTCHCASVGSCRVHERSPLEERAVTQPTGFRAELTPSLLFLEPPFHSPASSSRRRGRLMGQSWKDLPIRSRSSDMIMTQTAFDQGHAYRTTARSRDISRNDRPRFRRPRHRSKPRYFPASVMVAGVPVLYRCARLKHRPTWRLPKLLNSFI
jgi:hypothetical protein